MINRASVKSAMERRVRAFDNARELAENTAREMYLMEDIDELVPVAEEVVRRRDELERACLQG